MGQDLKTTISKLEQFRKVNPKQNVTISLTIEGRRLIDDLIERFQKLLASSNIKVNVNASLIIEMLLRICFSNLSGLGVPLARVNNQEEVKE